MTQASSRRYYGGLVAFILAGTLAAIWWSGTVRSREELDGPADVYRIPYLGSNTVPDFALLRQEGLEIQLHNDATGRFVTPHDFSATFWVGWNDRALWIAAKVQDDEWREHGYTRHLFQGDAIQVFVSRKRGSPVRYMLVISPGLDPEHLKARHVFFDDPLWDDPAVPEEKGVDYRIEAGSNDYRITLSLPWDNLSTKAYAGMELGLQLYAIDRDTDGQRIQKVWYPRDDSHVNRESVHRVILAYDASEPVTYGLGTPIDSDLEHTNVVVVGDRRAVGQPLTVALGRGRDLAAAFEEVRGRAVARVPIANFESDRGQAFTVLVDGRRVGVGELPSLSELRNAARFWSDVTLERYVLADETAVSIQASGPARLIPIKTQYFDNSYREVDGLYAPGRYAVVISLQDRFDVRTRRFFTVIKLEPTSESGGAEGPFKPTIDFSIPESFSDLLAPWREHARALHASGSRAVETYGQSNCHDTAIVIASYLSATDPNTEEDPWIANRRWWIPLKQRLNGVIQANVEGADVNQQPKKLSPPMLVDGEPAQAGFHNDLADQLDRFFDDAAAAHPGEPLLVTIVKEGVVVYEKAFGRHPEGTKAEIFDRVNLHSITKVITAITFLTIESTDVSMDMEVGTILSCFAQSAVGRPLIVRDLVNHTSGLPDVFEWSSVDVDEKLAWVARDVEANGFRYSEAGYSTVAALIEMLTGESYADYCLAHVLRPMGIPELRVRGAHSGALATSREVAVLAQYLLEAKKGESSTTIQRAVAAEWPKSTDAPGLGLYRIVDPSLSSEAVGAGTVNSGRMILDPEQELVVVVLSAGHEKRFTAEYPRLLRLITKARRRE